LEVELSNLQEQYDYEKQKYISTKTESDKMKKDRQELQRKMDAGNINTIEKNNIEIK